MPRNSALICLLICLFLTISCTQQLQPDTLREPVLIVTPLDDPIDSPMEMIKKFAKQTAVAQTETARLSNPSFQDVTPLSSPFPADKKILHIVFSNDSRMAFSPEDLSAFPKTSVLVRDQDVEGVSLLTVLERSGWSVNTSVAVSLHGIGSVTLPADGIGEDFVLVFTGNSLGFISPSIPETMWIEGVTVIEVY